MIRTRSIWRPSWLMTSSNCCNVQKRGWTTPRLLVVSSSLAPTSWRVTSKIPSSRYVLILHLVTAAPELCSVQFLGFMWNPLSWVMEAAALVAIVVSNGEGMPPDWEDFIGIICLLFANSLIGFYEERNAGNAVKALMDSLAPKAKVKRNGNWKEIESADLVPGDMIAFKIGDIVPADCRLTEAVNVSIDQAALTGESLPQSKKVGDQCFS